MQGHTTKTGTLEGKDGKRQFDEASKYADLSNWELPSVWFCIYRGRKFFNF